MRTVEPRRRLLLVAAFAITCCAVCGCERFSPTTSPTPAAPVVRQVYALGRLQPAEGIISISAIPGERLKELDPDVVENERTPANGILGVLASYDVGKTQLEAVQIKAELAAKKRESEIQVATAQKAQAEAGLAEALAKQRELELQAGKLAALEVASQLAADEYAQLVELSESDPELVTAYQLAKQANRMEMAAQDFRIADQSYGSTKAAAAKAVAAARANIRVAKMTLEQLQLGYDQQAIEQEIMVAEETLKRSILLAPNVSASELDNVTSIESAEDRRPGDPETYGPFTVLKTFVRPGEFITQMPIVQLADLSEMVCIAEVYEADVKEIEVGQAVTIRSPAFAGEFADGPLDPDTGQRSGGIRGRVQRIGSLVASPGLANRNPLAPADRSVVEVRIEINGDAATQHAAKRVGLQVTVEFAERGRSTDDQPTTSD